MSSGDAPVKRNDKGQFGPGNGGRKKGARNRLHADFIVACEEHWHEVGSKALDIVFKELPKEYLKIMVSLFPREVVLEDGRLESMSDDELNGYLDEIRKIRTSTVIEHIEHRGGGAIEDGSGARSRAKEKIV